MLNYSPLPQASDVFTLGEYQKFLADYWQRKKSLLVRETLDESEDWENAYRARLPRYLLARCPFCGGRVWEGIDTFSLNSQGWVGSTGHGWYGRIATTSRRERRGDNSLAFVTRPSYETDCEHVQLVDWCLNLNGHKADNVVSYFTVTTLTEVPHLITWPMLVQGVAVVLHALSVGRHDDTEPTAWYTTYFMTYFAQEPHAFANQQAQITHVEVDRTVLVRGPFDYDLVKWVRRGRLFWLEATDPNLPLRNGPIETFPYANVQGRREQIDIFEGKERQYETFWQRLGRMWPGRHKRGE